MTKSILGHLTPDQFLQEYWQKKPLLIRQAYPDYTPPISGDELAGLALEEEVESRIVLEQGATPWELRNGPFSADDFAKLPDRHWTLLVQAVDHWVPELHALLADFSFLPSWRLDDIMVSYAVDGGNTGPHYDQYDVFLLQASGKRHWQVGPVYDSSAPRLDDTPLNILSEFDSLQEHLLEPGDMLYLPPGVGHHGVAVGDCLTISIGFRAPSHKEILVHFTDFLSDRLPEHLRYADTGLTPPQDNNEIDEASLDRLQSILGQHLQNRELLGQWFGEMMTTPKYEADLGEEIQDWTSLLQTYNGCSLFIEASTRLAYRRNGSDFNLFVDGTTYPCRSSEAKQLSLQLCKKQPLESHQWEELNEKDSQVLLTRLLNVGAIYPE